jgi:sugar phosphate isomerase/epimerase
MKRLFILPAISLCLWTAGVNAAGYLPNTAADVTAGTGICNFTGEYYSDHFYDLIQASGVKIIRVSFGWDTIEQSPDEYKYDTINLYDDVIDKCAQRGIRVMGTLGYTNPLYGDGYQPYQPEYYGTQKLSRRLFPFRGGRGNAL